MDWSAMGTRQLTELGMNEKPKSTLVRVGHQYALNNPRGEDDTTHQ
jgi:hypothetical protein